MESGSTSQPDLLVFYNRTHGLSGTRTPISYRERITESEQLSATRSRMAGRCSRLTVFEHHAVQQTTGHKLVEKSLMPEAGHYSTGSVSGLYSLYYSQVQVTYEDMNYVSMNIVLKFCTQASVLITVTTYGVATRYQSFYITLSPSKQLSKLYKNSTKSLNK